MKNENVKNENINNDYNNYYRPNQNQNPKYSPNIKYKYPAVLENKK